MIMADAPVVDGRTSFTWAIENSVISSQSSIILAITLSRVSRLKAVVDRITSWQLACGFQPEAISSIPLSYGQNKMGELKSENLDKVAWDNKQFCKKEHDRNTQHQFHARESDWGFTDFILIMSTNLHI
ncbi:TRAF-like protein [Senna tora]|uniref:TRAF-like protein n=1 Tax=Senna tora TaxID=362788 RepID=A0A834X762_9FABA|nr:TRAF-like protein [Senna tora]